MILTLVAFLVAMTPQEAPVQGPEAGYIVRGTYSNHWLGISLDLHGKWQVKALPAPSRGNAPQATIGGYPRKPQHIHVELQSHDTTVWISGVHRDISKDFSSQVEPGFRAMQERLSAEAADVKAYEQYKDRHLYVQGLTLSDGAGGSTGRLLGFESGGYVVTIAILSLPKKQKEILQIARSLSFQSESPEFRPDLLLRATHGESNGFAFGSTAKTTEVFRDGTVKYECLFSPWFGNRPTRSCGDSFLRLSSAELASIVSFLEGQAILGLEEEYRGEGMGTDYAGAMTILIPREHGGQWVQLPGLGFSGENNNKLYPAAVHSLVCKIFGLRRRAGDRYGLVTSYPVGQKPHDDTWCSESDLRL